MISCEEPFSQGFLNPEQEIGKQSFCRVTRALWCAFKYKLSKFPNVLGSEFNARGMIEKELFSSTTCTLEE